jgi:hypothetical protein
MFYIVISARNEIISYDSLIDSASEIQHLSLMKLMSNCEYSGRSSSLPATLKPAEEPTGASGCLESVEQRYEKAVERALVQSKCGPALKLHGA